VVLDVNTLEERHRLTLDVDERFWDVAFSPDGRLLAGGGESGRLHVIDLGTWEPRDAVSVHDGPLLQLGWLDDRTVVSTGMDGTVRLFDVERAVERGSPLPASVDAVPGYGHWITAPDGELVVFNDDRVALRYPTDPAVWLGQACAVVGRDLTPAEWEQYLPGRPWQATCSDLG
jgi:WD40 repeat protein